MYAFVGVSIHAFVVGEQFFCQDPKQTADEHAKLGYPGAEEMAYMFKFYQKGIERDIALTKKLNPKVKNFEEFVKKHKSDFESFM